MPFAPDWNINLYICDSLIQLDQVKNLFQLWKQNRLLAGIRQTNFLDCWHFT